MYNMQITITVEIIILMIVLFFILSSHLLCSCAQTTPLEAFTSMASMATGMMNKQTTNNSSAPTATSSNSGEVTPVLSPNITGGSPSAPQGATLKEGFQGSKLHQPPLQTKSWFSPNLTYSPGKPVSKGIQNILNRPKQPVPLPEGEMFMFQDTSFSPSCCPNTYTNSMGCACMTVDQYNYLIDRGGNNVPYSEY